MIELLRDPAWQFVGALLALVALAATVIIYLLQRQKKALSFVLLSKNQLLTVREELEGKLQVLYEGRPARDIRLLVLKITNSGNVAISSNDYERPVSIATGARSKILSAAVTEVEPKTLDAEVTVSDDKVTLTPVLLNSRDSITLKIIVSDSEESVTVDGRIIGVKNIEDSGKTGGYQTILMIGLLVSFFVGTYLTVKYSPLLEIPPTYPIKAKVGFGLLLISYIGMTILVMKSRNMKRVVRWVLNFNIG